MKPDVKPLLTDDQIDNIEAAARGRTGVGLLAHYKDTLLLIQEIRRLKRGEFSEREFKSLCHNLDTKDLQRFEQGCKDYQRKLFGFTRPKDEEERQALRKHYEGEVDYCCECGEEYPRVDLVIDGEVFCAKCREEEKQREIKKE